MKKLLLLIPMALLAACGAGGRKTDEENELTRSEYVPERNVVDTIHLRLRPFHREIVSNGRLRAIRKSDLRFALSGELAAVQAINGQRVAAGTVIARLDTTASRLKLLQAEQQARQAYYDLADILIGFGQGADTATVPKDILQTAYIRAGYQTAQGNLILARRELEQSALRAPFAGKIANLNRKTYEQTSGGEVFCTLIDDSVFEVEFSLLESEIPSIRTGQKLRISPFNTPDQIHDGRITQINPVVDERGQITLRAEVANRGEHLMEGMNVKVIVEEARSNQITVPKSAVVIRDNLEVLFRMGPDGKAIWTYINVLLSNSTDHVVTANTERGAELNPGDIIITSGNLNLADGSTVEARP